MNKIVFIYASIFIIFLTVSILFKILMFNDKKPLLLINIRRFVMRENRQYFLLIQIISRVFQLKSKTPELSRSILFIKFFTNNFY